MLPSSVAKCMTTNYYAIIYDHDHSKHINDHFICRQDNDVTCLNCKVDFFFFFSEMASCCLTLSFFWSSLLSPTFEMQVVCESVTQLVHHSHYRSHLSFSSSSLSVSVCPGMIKDSFVTPCKASRKQRTSNHNSQKDMHTGNRDTCKARVGVCDKQMNKFKTQERARGDFVSTFSTSMKGRKVSLWSPFLYRSERGGKGLHESCCLAS